MPQPKVPIKTFRTTAPERITAKEERNARRSPSSRRRGSASVDVELSGPNLRATPIVSGKLLSVSAGLLIDPANPEIRYFNARIDMSGARLDVPPTAGMLAVAYIRTRDRTPLELWLDPVVGALRHSLRERQGVRRPRIAGADFSPPSRFHSGRRWHRVSKVLSKMTISLRCVNRE